MIKSINNDSETYRKYLCAWVILGADNSKMNEIGLFAPDLGKGNFLFNSDEQQIYRINFELTEKRDYLLNWKDLPDYLKSLFVWARKSEAAAFRFGYINEGGPIAKEVFNLLRSKYNLSIFNYNNNEQGIHFNTGINKRNNGEIEKKYKQWLNTREIVEKYADLKKNLEIEQVSNWFKNKEKLGMKKNFDANIFVYNRHLVSGLFTGSLHTIIEALINLAGTYKQKNINKAYWIMEYCEKLQDSNFKMISKESRAVFDVLFDKLKTNHSIIRPKIMDEIIKENVFEFLWALDDLEYLT